LNIRSCIVLHDQTRTCLRCGVVVQRDAAAHRDAAKVVHLLHRYAGERPPHLPTRERRGPPGPPAPATGRQGPGGPEGPGGGAAAALMEEQRALYKPACLPGPHFAAQACRHKPSDEQPRGTVHC